MVLHTWRTLFAFLDMVFVYFFICIHVEMTHWSGEEETVVKPGELACGNSATFVIQNAERVEVSQVEKNIRPECLEECLVDMFRFNGTGVDCMAYRR